MKCTNCGYETDKEISVCPVCNRPIAPSSSFSASSPLAAKLSALFNDPLFLVVCILVTVSAGLGVLSASFDVLKILYSVVLWLIYVNCRGGNVDAKYIRNLSGTVYASYIVTNITAVIGGICGVIGGILLPIAAESELVSDLLDALDIGASFLPALGLFAATAWLIIIFSVIICGVILVFNYLGRRRIHAFLKAQHIALSCGGENYADLDGAKTWLMVLGVFTGVSALSSSGLDGLLSTACFAAALIIGSLLLGRHFIGEGK